MDAEVIAIGDELTSGQRLDTNSQWISQRLGELGVRAVYHTTVADDLKAGIDVFRSAIGRAEIIVASGGLGPTADDLTRETIAAAAGVELLRDDEALAGIWALFARRGRDMPERNVVQAMFPAGSRIIPNPHGTAPGIDLVVERPERAPCRIFALPGVPAELFEMWHQTVRDRIASLAPQEHAICHHVLKCFGVGESDLEQMLPDIIRRGRVPQVGITVHQATITLRITAEGTSEADCRAAMQPTIATIHECLGPLVFGEGDDELHDAVARLCAAKNVSLATAEWGTDGLLACWLASQPLLAHVYRGGLVIHDADALPAALDIPSAQVAAQGPTSAALANAMATELQKRMRVDYALAVSDVPHGAFGDQLPRFHVALATPTGLVSRGFSYAGHPAILQELSAKRALNLLRLTLLGE